MNKLSIKRFKGFGDTGIEFDLNNLSLLLCGENGSGKTSLFDAFKWIFFRNTIFSEIPATTRPEDRELLEKRIKDRFSNRLINQPFEIDIDGINFESYNSQDYQVDMLPSSCTDVIDHIHVDELCQKCLMTNFFRTEFLENNIGFLQNYVNVVLKEDFKEDISISFSTTAPYICTINDPKHGLSVDSNLPHWINEAKLRIIIICIIFSIVNLRTTNSSSRILIIDDIMNSLDAANRTLFAKYLYTAFCQTHRIFLLTHNVSIYNLLIYYDNNIASSGHKFNWQTYHLFSGAFEPIAYQYPVVQEVEFLEHLLSSYPTGGMSLDDIGNKIRKKFESLVHQFTRLLVLGAREETSNIIKTLSSSPSFYFKENGKTCEDLIRQIETIIHRGNVPNKTKVISRAINSYKKENKLIHEWLNELVLLQKIALHPMSHQSGLVNYTIKELTLALEVMKKIESTIKAISNNVEITQL